MYKGEMCGERKREYLVKNKGGKQCKTERFGRRMIMLNMSEQRRGLVRKCGQMVNERGIGNERDAELRAIRKWDM